MHQLSFSQLFSIAFIAFCVLLAISFVSAWSGPNPNVSPPNDNVLPPINVGTVSQIKDGVIGVDGLAVFGTTYIQTKLGINDDTPVVALDVAGTARLGNGGEVCQAVTEGAQRYNTTTKQMEFCDGVSWRAVSESAVFHVRHQLPAGTTPSTGTANTWYTRPLNTVVTNEVSGASLSGNQVSLPAGTYEVSAFVSSGCGTYASYVDQVRFRNVSDGTTVAVGLMGFLARGTSATGDAGGNASFIPYSRFTISGTKSFELQQYTTYAMYLGCASAGGEVGVYADVILKKL